MPRVDPVDAFPSLRADGEASLGLRGRALRPCMASPPLAKTNFGSILAGQALDAVHPPIGPVPRCAGLRRRRHGHDLRCLRTGLRALLPVQRRLGRVRPPRRGQGCRRHVDGSAATAARASPDAGPPAPRLCRALRRGRSPHLRQYRTRPRRSSRRKSPSLRHPAAGAGGSGAGESRLRRRAARRRRNTGDRTQPYLRGAARARHARGLGRGDHPRRDPRPGRRRDRQPARLAALAGSALGHPARDGRRTRGAAALVRPIRRHQRTGRGRQRDARRDRPAAPPDEKRGGQHRARPARPRSP